MHERSNESLALTVTADRTLVASGELDMGGGPLLEALVRDWPESDPLVIDLRGVDFIDSSGLRALLGAVRYDGERRPVVTLRAPTAAVLRLLEITGTADLFTIEA